MLASSLWIAWTLIGIIGGFMVGRLGSRTVNTVLSVCVGICGALLGGWLTIISFGTAERIEILSLVLAAVGCALFLGILARMSPTRKNRS